MQALLFRREMMGENASSPFVMSGIPVNTLKRFPLIDVALTINITSPSCVQLILIGQKVLIDFFFL